MTRTQSCQLFGNQQCAQLLFLNLFKFASRCLRKYLQILFEAIKSISASKLQGLILCVQI